MGFAPSLQAFAASRDLGRIEALVPLKGTIAWEGGSAPAHLCQTDRGVWLVGASDGTSGHAIDLCAENGRVAYESKATGDVIRICGNTYSVGFGHGEQAKRALALGRLARSHPAVKRRPQDFAKRTGHLFAGTTDVRWQRLLAGLLGADEEIVALLATATKRKVSSTIVGDHEIELQYLLTTRRHALIAISEVGDVHLDELPWTPLGVTIQRVGRTPISCGDVKWQAALINANAYEAVASLPGMEPAPCCHEAARTCFLDNPREPDGQVFGLLDFAIRTYGRPIDALALALVRIIAQRKAKKEGWLSEQETDLDDALARLRKEAASSDVVKALFTSWRLPVGLGGELILRQAEALDRTEDARWWLDFHRFVWSDVRKSLEEDVLRVVCDLEFVGHAMRAEEYSEAERILRAALEVLPSSGEPSDLLIADDEDVTEGADAQHLRVRVLDGLRDVLHKTRKTHDVTVLRDIAVNQPLVVERLEALALHSTGTIKKRSEECAATVRDCGDSLPIAQEAARAGRVTPPSAAALEALEHPLARKRNLAGKLQAVIAKVKKPDIGDVRDHCESVDPAKHPAIQRAIDDGCVILGTKAVRCYISHGEAAIGVRGVAGDPDFLIVGGSHLEKDGGFILSETALRFCIGAELACFRFGYDVATRSELMDGVLDKGLSVAGTAAQFAPFLALFPMQKIFNKRATYKLVRKVATARFLKKIYGVAEGRKLVSAVGSNLAPLVTSAAEGIGSVAGQLQGVIEKGKQAKPDSNLPLEETQRDLSSDREGIELAHLAMLLSADRAGLVLCQSIRGAVEGLFKTHKRYQAELGVARRHGLVACLSRRDAKGNLLLNNLAIRIATLMSFYLSEEYEQICSQIYGAGPAQPQ